MTLSPLVVVRLWRIQKPNVVATPICLHVAFYLHDLFTDYTLSLSPRPQRSMIITIYSPVAPPLPRANPVKFRGRRAKRSSNVLLLRGRADINTEVLPKHRFALLLIKSGTDTLFFYDVQLPLKCGTRVYKVFIVLKWAGEDKWRAFSLRRAK